MNRHLSWLGLVVALTCGVGMPPAHAARADVIEYRVLATTKTSTMEKELNDAAAAGFRFQAVMGGDTAIGGKEVVVVTARVNGTKTRLEYRLLATNKTSTMQKEIQQAADAGFEYRGQTVFASLFGGNEVVSIMERDPDAKTTTYDYKLLATSRTSTMQKELQDVGSQGYEVVGMTVGKTALGGSELVTITRRKR
jgi:hypothetical protein